MTLPKATIPDVYGVGVLFLSEPAGYTFSLRPRAPRTGERYLCPRLRIPITAMLDYPTHETRLMLIPVEATQ